MKDWLYYSTLVPGYTERYGLSGMRERNAALLSMASKGRTEEELRPVANLLADNNQPLAMYVAHRFGRVRNWPHKEIMDAFQQCCITLIEVSLNYIMTQDINQLHYQRLLYVSMYRALAGIENRQRVNGEKIELIPFDEEIHSSVPEKEYHINTKLVGQLLREKERKIIFMFYGIGCREMDLEEISEQIGLTRERVRQIKKKAIDRLNKIIGYHQSKKSISRDMFLMESWEHPYSKQEQKRPITKVNKVLKPNLPKFFWDTNNDKLKH